MAFQDARDRLILALDVKDVATAERLVEQTARAVGVYKIGFELALAGGIALARDLAAAGHGVFLDMKLLDIANTVAGGVASAGALGVRYLTVHSYPQALSAAVAARPDGLAIVAVTVLTSLDDADLAAAGYTIGAAELVEQRLQAARDAGVDAVVCSPREATAAAQTGLTVITPGVRMAEDAAGDQKRIAPPDDAVAAGADMLVVGRPISAAAEPRAAAVRYAEAIEKGLERRALGSAADRH